MKKFILLLLVTFVTSCAKSTPLQNNIVCPCQIIYGRETDWDVISDDLARNIYKHNIACESFITNS